MEIGEDFLEGKSIDDMVVSIDGDGEFIHISHLIDEAIKLNLIRYNSYLYCKYDRTEFDEDDVDDFLQSR